MTHYEYNDEAAYKRFATFGPEVDPADVPALVRAGVVVWSFGYGDDPDDFMTIEPSDLWAWEGIDEVDPDPYTVESWAPFRRDIATGLAAATAPEPCPECGIGDAEYSEHEADCPSGYPTAATAPEALDIVASWISVAGDVPEHVAEALDILAGERPRYCRACGRPVDDGHAADCAIALANDALDTVESWVSVAGDVPAHVAEALAVLADALPHPDGDWYTVSGAADADAAALASLREDGAE
jgi:hypothetical protein